MHLMPIKNVELLEVYTEENKDLHFQLTPLRWAHRIEQIETKSEEFLLLIYSSGNILKTVTCRYGLKVGLVTLGIHNLKLAM